MNINGNSSPPKSILSPRKPLKEHATTYGLRTHNEGINQRYLKNWADVADKYASAVPKNLGVGVKAISSLGIRSPCFNPLSFLKSPPCLLRSTCHRVTYH